MTLNTEHLDFINMNYLIIRPEKPEPGSDVLFIWKHKGGESKIIKLI